MQQKQIEILYQNADFILVDKPAGMNFHSEQDEQGAFLPGLVVLVKQQLAVQELYPVHRLDKMTSGLILFALSKAVAQSFQRQFECHEVQKYYLAVSDKKPKKKQGWVIGDMLPARRGSWKLAKSKENPAKTQFISALIEPGLRLFLVKPISGKTHQIRVALKSVGAPIVGDGRYGDATLSLNADRGYLHAFAIKFTLKDQDYVFVQPPTKGQVFLMAETQGLIETWKTPWLSI